MPGLKAVALLVCHLRGKGIFLRLVSGGREKGSPVYLRLSRRLFRLHIPEVVEYCFLRLVEAFSLQLSLGLLYQFDLTLRVCILCHGFPPDPYVPGYLRFIVGEIEQKRFLLRRGIHVFHSSGDAEAYKAYVQCNSD